jgi:hypothetical protein
VVEYTPTGLTASRGVASSPHYCLLTFYLFYFISLCLQIHHLPSLGSVYGEIHINIFLNIVSKLFEINIPAVLLPIVTPPLALIRFLSVVAWSSFCDSSSVNCTGQGFGLKHLRLVVCPVG